MENTLIPKIVAVCIVVVISMFLPNSFWKRRSANKSWSAFAKWTKRSGFKLDERKPAWNSPDAPAATGKLHGVTVEIIVSPRSRGNTLISNIDYYTVVRAHANVKSDLQFKISIASISDTIAKKVGITEFATGNDSFDRIFDVDTNNKELMMQILDQHTTDNLVANEFLFHYAGLHYRQNFLRYETFGKLSTTEEIEHFHAIADFMAEMVAGIDKLNRRHLQ